MNLSFLKTKHTNFLKWLFVTVAYFVILATAKLLYNGHVHSIGLVAIVSVLALYVGVNIQLGQLLWRYDDIFSEKTSQVRHIWFAINTFPKLGMMGTVGGFLIAFSAGASDVQHRVLGASTGLAATFIGISAMVALEITAHILNVE